MWIIATISSNKANQMMTVPATFNQGSMDVAAAPSDDMLRQQSFQKTTPIALF